MVTLLMIEKHLFLNVFFQFIIREMFDYSNDHANHTRTELYMSEVAFPCAYVILD